MIEDEVIEDEGQCETYLFNEVVYDLLARRHRLACFSSLLCVPISVVQKNAINYRLERKTTHFLYQLIYILCLMHGLFDHFVKILMPPVVLRDFRMKGCN